MVGDRGDQHAIAGFRPHRVADLPPARRLACVAAVVLLVGTGSAALATQMSSSRTTVGDEARFGLEARTAASVQSRSALQTLHLSMHVRTVGVYTTSDLFGGPVTFEPGPMAHLMAMPFVRLLGTRDGLWTFAALVNTAAILLAGWATFRHSRGACAVVVVAGGLLTAALTTGGLVSPLNVNVVVLPSFAVFALAWALARGDVAMLPVAALLPSFIIQTHVGYALVPTAACAVATAILLTRHRPKAGGEHRRRYVVAAAAVLAVLWTLPLVDQFTGSGNLLALAGLRLPARGIDGAWRAIGAIFRFPPRAQPQVSDLTAPGPGSFVVLVTIGLVLVAARRQLRAARTVLAIWAAVIGGSLLLAAITHRPTVPGTTSIGSVWLWASRRRHTRRLGRAHSRRVSG
jgi:hypothetical protein